MSESKNSFDAEKIVDEKADLNRSTFYAHYVEVGDLLHEIENEMISNIPKVYGTLSMPK